VVDIPVVGWSGDNGHAFRDIAAKAARMIVMVMSNNDVFYRLARKYLLDFVDCGVGSAASGIGVNHHNIIFEGYDQRVAAAFKQVHTIGKLSLPDWWRRGSRKLIESWRLRKKGLVRVKIEGNVFVNNFLN